MSRRFTIPAFMFAALLILLTLGVAGAPPQDPCSMGTAFRDCQACGSAKSKKGQELNVLKNRDALAENVETITVPFIRKPSNNTKLSPETAVELTGYVVSVEKGGFQETCNCGESSLRDLHINVVAIPQERNNNRRFVIVEITPRFQEKLGFDRSNYTRMLAAANTMFKHKWVTFRGWLLYDNMHVSESESTNPHGPTNWRATPWEVHPVTSFKVLPGKPS